MGCRLEILIASAESSRIRLAAYEGAEPPECSGCPSKASNVDQSLGFVQAARKMVPRQCALNLDSIYRVCSRFPSTENPAIEPRARHEHRQESALTST